MPLTIEEIKEILEKSPSRNRSAIPRAIQQENRLRLHSETAIDRIDVSTAVTEFLEFVRTLLPEDKYRMFLSLFRFPLSTVTLTEEIYCALEKIFDGRNPFFKYQFASPEHSQDWEEYRNEILKVMSTWRTTGFETMKTAINSVIIADLKPEQSNANPEPYFYFLDIREVVDFELKDDAKFDWIIFKQPDNKLAVFCDGFYRVFQVEQGTTKKVIGEPIVENPHDLNYCPARFFWTTPVSLRKKTVKKSPLSNHLAALDLLLFFDISNEHLNLYARYPIYSAFASDCDFTDEQSGNYCDNGYLKNHEGLYILSERSDNALKACPVCEKKRVNGAGSFIEIDPPSRANDGADLRNPVQITGIERDALDYNNEDIRNRKQDIYAAITGFRGLPVNDQAINEKQVTAIFESLEASLKAPQMNFEQAIQWTDQTLCLLRYGSESFQDASVSLGTEHFIMTSRQIMELYELAKKANFSPSILDMLDDRYYETEFRNNPEQLQRHKILVNIDPFRHLSIAQVETMFGANKIKYEDYMLKVNFSSFIMRFERENIDILEFAKNIDFNTKIDRIKAELYKYAEEMKPEVIEPEPEPQPPTV